MNNFKSILIIVVSLIMFFSCNNAEQKLSDKIPAFLYYNGDIVTMEGDSAAYVEAVVVQEGKIVFAGNLTEAENQFNGAEKINLNHQTMLPGFIDAHGHVFNAGIQALSANLLPPPDGIGTDIKALISLAKEWESKNQTIINKVGWIIGFGYDDAQLSEKRHPTADELDLISKDVPVILIHQSGHLASINHKGLELAGINEKTENPKGGVIRRLPGTNTPDGVLEETAMFGPLFKLFGKIDSKGSEYLVDAGMKSYCRYGYTTAQEGRATADICETFRRMAADSSLFMDVYAYPDIQMAGNYVASNAPQKNYSNHFRIAGIKLSLDGSPQGKTAWLTQPYKVPPKGLDKNYKGYPAIPNADEYDSLVAVAFKNNWQIITHCNGDAAADAYISAIRLAANQYGNDDRRSVMIHAQTVREDQLDSMKALGIIPSFFSMHTFYWGDWHRDETLGKERAYRISPTASALARNMIFTEHHDAPVAMPEALRVLHATVNRVSRSGDIIGPDQRVTAYQGLKSITDWAAFAAFEENLKGTISVGKLADFVILDKNPLKVEPMAIIDLKVQETIKEGKTIYKAK